MSSKGPDMTASNAAAASQAATAGQMAQMSREQLEWSKQIYAETAPERADTLRRTNEISDAQLASMNQQTTLAADYDRYNKKTFRPLEQSIVQDSANYDTLDRREAAAATGMADVQAGLANARDSANRNLQRSGVQPGSARSMQMENAMSLGAAKAMAGSANAARTQVETIGAARKMDAASLGRGLAANQATSAGLALTAGNAASGNAQAAGNITAQGNQIMQNGYAGAQSGLSGAAGAYGGAAGNFRSNAVAGQRKDQWEAIGQIAGAGAKMYASSDKTMKRGRKPVDPEKSLAAVRKTPVDSWQYKRGSKADDGGKTHVGPMAQDVKRNLGEAAAPGGKVIDLITMNGHLVNAVKALDKKVASLADAKRKYA